MAPNTTSEFRAGALAILPAAIAVVPFGLLLGALAAKKGLSPLEVALMSASMFAGSAQFVAVDFWQHPAPWAFLTLTALTINLRHVMMGASLSRHLGAFPPASRPLWIFFLADEIWAMAERRAANAELTPAYYAGLAMTLYLNWVCWSTAGSLFGSAMGDPVTYGFDFAFTAIFIGLIIGFWKGPSTAVVMVASALAAIAAERFVGGAWYILIGGIAGIVVAAVLSLLQLEAVGDER